MSLAGTKLAIRPSASLLDVGAAKVLVAQDHVAILLVFVALHDLLHATSFPVFLLTRL
jgi:hypothetical protein